MNSFDPSTKVKVRLTADQPIQLINSGAQESWGRFANELTKSLLANSRTEFKTLTGNGKDSMKTETIAMSVPRDTFYLVFLRNVTSELARRGGFEHGVVGQIEMAVDEACANACEHQSCESPIDFEISLCEQQLTVTLRGEGRPYSSPVNCTVDLDSWAESDDEGGLGLHIINQFMDEVSYQHHEGVGNILCMKKYR